MRLRVSQRFQLKGGLIIKAQIKTDGGCAWRKPGIPLLHIILCGYLTAWCAVDAIAATQPAEFEPGTTLADYLSYAEAHNPGLAAVELRWKAAQERVEQIKVLPDPHVSYGYFLDEVETRVGPQEQKFGISQTIPWFGTLGLREEGASRSADAVRQKYEKAKFQLLYSVKSAYCEYWYLGRAIAVTRSHMKLVTNLEGVARARFKAGTAAHLSVIQAQLELGKLDDRLRSLQALQSPVVARLNAALNRPATLPLPWPQNMPDLEVSLSEEQVEEWLAASNPDLIRLGHLARKEDTAIKLAKKDSYPDITFGIEYMDTGEASNPATPDSGKDPVMAMISASVPIWYGKNRSALREARYRKAAVEKELEDTGNHLASDLLLALYHFEDAERKVDLYRDTLVPKAEQSLSVAQQGFEAGNTSFLSLVDAQRLLLEFQLLHEGAISERGKRIAEIEMLTGRRIISD